MSYPIQRRQYSRADLAELKCLDRAGVYDVLGSFDERGLADDTFVQLASHLLDGLRIPGLADAGSEPAAILDAVYSTCTRQGAGPEKPLAALPAHMQDAEEILRHRFRFYDELHALPDDIDWDYNPGTAHWGHDLNRFSYLNTLLRASAAPGGERFSRKAIDLVLDWIAKCDFGCAFAGTPYVFGSYLNQAIHCEAWCHCLRQLLPQGQIRPLELLRVLKSLHDQLAYLEVVTSGHAGNWPTIGCRGMLATLAAFPVLRDTGRFARHCIDTLAAQIDDQVLPDGVQDELTPHYHWNVVGNLVSASISARSLGLHLAPRTLATLRRMVHYTRQTVVPDRSAQVAFNDSDPASVPQLDGLLQRAGLEEDSDPTAGLGPELFPYAGVAFLRQRSDRGDLYLAFDGGPFGRSHQHEDKLGFWLFAYGRSFLVDPGRHLYDASSPVSCMLHLRSTRAHSTILIDGAGQHSRGRPDAWIATEPVPLQWSVGEEEIRAAASYTLGYGENNSIDVEHRREIVFVQERFWVVFDRVVGTGVHGIESRFQFAPGPLRLDGGRAHTAHADANLLLWPVSSVPYADVRIEEGEENPPSGWYSPRYGLLEPAPCLSLRVKQLLPFSAITLLCPYAGERMPDITLAVEGTSAIVQIGAADAVRVESQLT